MGLFNFLDFVLDPLLGPLLKLHPFFSLFIITLLISIILVVIYKFTTNQEELKKIKEKQKKLQAKMKKLSKPSAGNTKTSAPDPANFAKIQKLQKEMMSLSGKQMKHSFNSMLYTFIPIIILFGWLSAHLAFYPILPGEEFTLDVFLKNEVSNAEFLDSPGLILLSNSSFDSPSESVSWTLVAEEEGIYTANIQIGKEVFTKEVVISEDLGPSISAERSTRSSFLYGTSEKALSKTDPISSIVVSNEKIKPLKGFPLFSNWGWFGVYIVLSLILSISLRKLLKVY